MDSLEKTFIFLKEVLEGGKNFEGISKKLDKELFKCFEERRCKRVAAIDGSSCDILDGEFFIIGGRRVGYVIADDKKILERKIGEIKVDFLSKESSLIQGTKIPENPHEINEMLREMEEHLMAREAIKKLGKGDVLLMDGSLEFSSKIMEENFEMARRKGIHVVGISKKSGLAIKNVSIINWVKRNGDKLFVNKRWYYPFSEGRYIVKFHPLSRFIFRVDMHEENEQVLREISSLCNDVCFLGYPYPLADVHNNVVIKSHDCLAIKTRLQKMVIESGFSMDDWETLFFDYHEYLR